MRRKKIKSLFLALDDLWLYNYHQQHYDGTIYDVFETIRFIEEKQWELAELETVRDEIESSIS